MAALCGLLLLWLAVFWGRYVAQQHSALGFVSQRDFVGLYVGPSILAHGAGARLYDFAQQRAMNDVAIAPIQHRGFLPFIYPAYVAALLQPLGWVSLVPAFFLWTTVNLAATAWMLVRVLHRAASDMQTRIVVLLVMLASLPLQLTLFHGQAGLLVAVGLMETWLALEQRRQAVAGLWLALGLIKPHLLVFPVLVLLLWRQWRTLISFLAVAAALIGASFLQAGTWFVPYFHFVAACNRIGAGVGFYPQAMQNWRGIFVFLGVGKGFLWPAIFAGLSAIPTVWLCLRVRLPEDGHEDMSAASSVWAISMLIGLISAPHLYLHDWVIALPAGLFLWQSFLDQAGDNASVSRDLRRLGTLLAAAPAAFLGAQFMGSSGPLPVAPVYGLALIGVALVWLRQTRKLT